MHLDAGEVSTELVLDDLEKNWPLMVGLKTEKNLQAFVLTGAYFQGETKSALLTKVILRDPIPGSESRNEMSYAKFASVLVESLRVRVER